MKGSIDHTTLARWRRHPIRFIEQVLCDPETGKPFVLLDAERSFLKEAFKFGPDGRLLYPELIYSAPKKSGKTTLAALFILTIILLFGGRFGEAYAVANDLEQAQSRVYEFVRRIVLASPLLAREAKVTATKITFPAFGDAQVSAIASDYAGAAGGAPTISVFDELWAFTAERSRRLFDEMIWSPTRKVSCRLTVTYAGFSSESVLLEELYKRGLALPQVGPSLFAGEGLLMAWHHEAIAPWQSSQWIEQMRKALRPNQFARMIRNEFVTSESTFVDLAAWDRCVDQRLGHALGNRALPVFVGVDASMKHDATAIVAVALDRAANLVRLVTHRVFQPSPDKPLDFEATIESYLLDLNRRFSIRRVRFDPYQMQATAQRLARAGLVMEEWPQSVPNLTAIGQNLYDLIMSGGILLYPDPAMRLAASRAIAVETPRGWRIAKAKASHRVDLVVALAMAASAAVQSQSESAYGYDRTFSGFMPDAIDIDDPDPDREYRAERLRAVLAGRWDFVNEQQRSKPS